MIRFAAAADADLADIQAYLTPRAGEAVTNSVIDSILDAVERLDQMPELGRPGRRTGTRELSVAQYPYLIIYRIAGGDVEIARVLHHRMQWPAAAEV